MYVDSSVLSDTEVSLPRSYARLLFVLCVGFGVHGPVVAQSELDEISVTDKVHESTATDDATALQKNAANATLGGYLDRMPNVDSASFGEGVGRPVVRGMGGYRVKILQNDHEVTDLSAMSHDHAVAVAPRASERIELLKGPASLLYAARAGGVIRITDSLDAPFPRPGVHGELSAESALESSAQGVDAKVTMANEVWAVHLSGVHHDAENYRAKGNTIADSDVMTEQGQIGIGWRPTDQLEWQLNASRLVKDYGIPNSTPEETRIDMARDNVGLKMRYLPASAWLDEVIVDTLISDYLHDETEGGRKDGLFGQSQKRGSVKLAWGGDEWSGETRIGIAQGDLQVCHEHGACDDFYDAARTGAPMGESLRQYLDSKGLPYSHGHPMPDTDTDLLQASTVAYRMLDDQRELSVGVHWQARQLTADPDNIQEQWVYPTDLDADHYQRRDDQTLSASIGVNRLATERDLGWEVSLGYLQRLPSVDELYWNGFHHATDSYIFGNIDLEKERSINLDLDVVLPGDRQQVSLSGFFYRFNDYIYQDQGFANNGDALRDPFHLSPVWFTRQKDANFYGGSIRYENSRLMFKKQQVTLWGQLDLLDATLDNGERIPRLSPASAEIGLRYEPDNAQVSVSLKHVDKARKLAPNETNTAGYQWLSFYLQRDWQRGDQTLELWLKGENMLDEEARNHLSPLKTTAPLPGRQLTAGVNWRF